MDGSVLLFDGQATVFLPGKGCYRCLYPTPPPPGLVPSCAEAGVLGALPGVIGCIQAIETMKLILGAGESLAAACCCSMPSPWSGAASASAATRSALSAATTRR